MVNHNQCVYFTIKQYFSLTDLIVTFTIDKNYIADSIFQVLNVTHDKICKITHNKNKSKNQKEPRLGPYGLSLWWLKGFFDHFHFVWCILGHGRCKKFFEQEINIKKARYVKLSKNFYFNTTDKKSRENFHNFLCFNEK